MKTSTQKQLNQLLAQLLTTVKPAQLSHERIQVAIKDTDGLAACFCEFVNNYPVATPKVVPAEQSATLISVRKGIPLGNHKARPMSKLFRNRDGVIFYYRDGDFDNWFAENSPECSAGTAELVETSCVMKFRQMTQLATGLATESIPDLTRAITAKKLDITPAQWDDAIAASQKGEDVLLTDGRANFAFARSGKKLKDEKGKEYDEVGMLYSGRDGSGRWVANVYRLYNDDGWNAGAGLLLRNSP